MLKSHMDASEQSLLAISKIPENSGHTLHKGTPREAFIKEFLESHLPENIAIGTGEIINSNSRPGEKRNQFDIVLYQKNFPKLDFGGGISGFLIESVVATIEVKSTLTKKDMEQSVNAASNAKSLNASVEHLQFFKYLTPKVLNFVVAYDGPASMQTVYKWIPEIHKDMGIIINNLPQERLARSKVSSPSIDAVFILGKGLIYFDNVPYGVATDEVRARHPNMKWLYRDKEDENILMLFMFLLMVSQSAGHSFLNPTPYLASLGAATMKIGNA